MAINTETVAKAVASATIAGQGNNLVLNISSFYKPTQPGAYPIILVTYELVCSKYSDAQTATAVRAFLQSTLGAGQANLEDDGYFPLPNKLIESAQRRQRYQLIPNQVLLAEISSGATRHRHCSTHDTSGAHPV